VTAAVWAAALGATATVVGRVGVDAAGELVVERDLRSGHGQTRVDKPPCSRTRTGDLLGAIQMKGGNVRPYSAS
jgi:sugar/nucleoside kinase (ribokinase family)